LHLLGYSGIEVLEGEPSPKVLSKNQDNIDLHRNPDTIFPIDTS